MAGTMLRPLQGKITWSLDGLLGASPPEVAIVLDGESAAPTLRSQKLLLCSDASSCELRQIKRTDLRVDAKCFSLVVVCLLTEPQFKSSMQPPPTTTLVDQPPVLMDSDLLHYCGC